MRVKNENKVVSRRTATVALCLSIRSADFQICCVAGFPARKSSAFESPADWEIGGTAGLSRGVGCATSKAAAQTKLSLPAKNQTEIRPNQTKKWQRHLPSAISRELVLQEPAALPFCYPTVLFANLRTKRITSLDQAKKH
jgi:hypothetical protein